ncbi:50S ribosomal protein L9 [Marispirochaeta aestuarii]|uniref:Large ribosomal subunit protein bL9 n=1 Tax=Marispirochaeta aestuarii TaxID=1963862 RepID=A0A1Y1S067_9SPIO|nr:50S ribosomal protein L9 [Marispirochaeta aestuarii]ORC36583.1 50S ribosomal protein L9 [Marispirochaeta aestuarii]
MKIILKEDVYNLGEEGDIRVVKPGYARNYLIPQGLAVPFNKGNAAMFEQRREAIEKRKEEKRNAAMGLKERIETLELTIPMPAGDTGKLFGSVTNATVSDALAKEGIHVERKKIDLVEHTIKMIGKHKARIKLYESNVAELQFLVVDEKTGAVEPKGTVKAEKEAPVQQDAPEEETSSEEEALDEAAAEESEDSVKEEVGEEE